MLFIISGMFMIIAFSGKMGSGKTLGASLLMSMLSENDRFKPKLKSFAKPIYEVAAIILGKEVNNLNNNKNLKTKYGITVREILQIIGDDLRFKVHENIWIDALFQEGYTKDQIWIIDDLRYQNEAHFLMDNYNAMLVRVHRYGEKKDVNILNEIKKHDDYVENHKSETDLDRFRGWTTEIHNISDVESYVNRVRDKVYSKLMAEMNPTTLKSE